ncbi:MAG: hypothetical protein EOP84_37180 [Verrucomicrobiaceae bacterium]|nr:MAG: hypothetical protein EOP84_37180 [Verrucomicrobiaceae bacterium]
MTAVAAGILSAFAWSYGLWAVARMQDLNLDPPEAGLIKSAVHALLLALPMGLVAHVVVEFFRMRTWWIVPVALGIGVLAAISLMAFESQKGLIVNVLGFLGMPVAFAIPYCLMLKRSRQMRG